MSWSSSAYLDECYHDTEASGDRKDYYQGIHFRMPRWSTGDPINSADVNSSMRPSDNGFAQGLMIEGFTASDLNHIKTQFEPACECMK